MKCPVSNCLGHALERTEEVACARCRGRRWLLLPNAEPVPAGVTCQRCRAVLTGANAIDPYAEGASPALRAARALAAERLRKAVSAGKKAPGRGLPEGTGGQPGAAA